MGSPVAYDLHSLRFQFSSAVSVRLTLPDAIVAFRKELLLELCTFFPKFGEFFRLLLRIGEIFKAIFKYITRDFDTHCLKNFNIFYIFL